MIVFKAFDKKLRCSKGNGVVQYAVGKTESAERSETRRTGIHSSEYVLECLVWYPLSSGGRVFECIAEDDIDEASDHVISSTLLTPVKELSLPEIVSEALAYMLRHPEDAGWELSSDSMCVARKDEATALKGGIAIARGENPKVRGKKGSVLALYKEGRKGRRPVARLFTIGERWKPDTWYTLSGNEIVEVACND